MNITFVIYGLGSGGAERVVTGLANYWSQKHNISIITLVKTVPFYQLQTNVKLLHCLEDKKTKTTTLSSIKNGALRIIKLKKKINILQSDVVIGFMLTSNLYSIWASKYLGIPCIISERSNHNINKLPKFQQYIRDWSYPYCSNLVVQTVGNRDYYHKFLPSVKKSIIPNAISPDLKLKRQVYKKRDRIILNVGSFKDGKAQDLLIRAFAAIDNQDWRIIFLGKGPNLENYKSLADTLGVSKQIDFKGAQKDVASYYNKADMFVFTSEHEGFPNALLEALYFGLPCISTNCPHGPSDLIEEGVNGFLIPVGNQKKLEEKLLQLINDEELRNRFRKEAIEQSKKYEIEPIAKQWMEVIKSVMV